MNGVFVTQFRKGWPLCLYTGRPKASEASHAIRERLWRALVAEETAVVAQAKFKDESEKKTKTISPRVMTGFMNTCEGFIRLVLMLLKRVMTDLMT